MHSPASQNKLQTTHAWTNSIIWLISNLCLWPDTESFIIWWQMHPAAVRNFKIHCRWSEMLIVDIFRWQCSHSSISHSIFTFCHFCRRQRNNSIGVSNVQFHLFFHFRSSCRGVLIKFRLILKSSCRKNNEMSFRIIVVESYLCKIVHCNFEQKAWERNTN